MKYIAILLALTAVLVFAPQTQAQEPVQDEPAVQVSGGDGAGAGKVGFFAARRQFAFVGQRQAFVGVQARFFTPRVAFIPTQTVFIPSPTVSVGFFGVGHGVNGGYAGGSFSGGFRLGCGH